MKKGKFCMVTFFFVSMMIAFTFIYSKESNAGNSVNLMNLEALATPEIEIAFCIYSPRICVKFSDDHTFIWGYRQY